MTTPFDVLCNAAHGQTQTVSQDRPNHHILSYMQDWGKKTLFINSVKLHRVKLKFYTSPATSAGVLTLYMQTYKLEITNLLFFQYSKRFRLATTVCLISCALTANFTSPSKAGKGSDLAATAPSSSGGHD